MSAQEKTVQIDSFDAKFLDINTLGDAANLLI